MKHTPYGPWKFDKDGDLVSPGSQKGYKNIIATRGMKGICVIHPANARLITAAPDLYKACKILRNYVAWVLDKYHPETGFDLDGLDTIIAKVEEDKEYE
jgi:hypothetical protein